MNVFICLLSTKERSARARAGGVWWDEMRACALWVAVALSDAGLQEVQSSWGGTDEAQSVWWGKQFKHLQKLPTSLVSKFPTDPGMHGLNSQIFTFYFTFFFFFFCPSERVAGGDEWPSATFNCMPINLIQLTVVDFQTSTLIRFSINSPLTIPQGNLGCLLISMWSGTVLESFQNSSPLNDSWVMIPRLY